MPVFRYRARTTNGTIVSATLEAPDQRGVAERLRQQKLILIDSTIVTMNPILAYLKKISPFQPHVSSTELVLFSRQFSTLITAGVPIVQGLTILMDQVETPLINIFNIGPLLIHHLFFGNQLVVYAGYPGDQKKNNTNDHDQYDPTFT